jgi:hypothetical protein
MQGAEMSSPARGAAAPNAPTNDVVDAAILERAIADVVASRDDWVTVSPGERVDLLSRIVRDTYAVAEAWNTAACAAKGYDPNGPEGGEELFSGVGTFIQMAQAFKNSMIDIAEVGRPRFPGPVRHRPGGRVSVQVLPATRYDRVLFAKTTAEVWMTPGESEADVIAGQAAAYRDPVGHRGVSLVLAAGNVGALGPRDVLTKLFADGKVVVLKANPVNDYLVPYWTLALSALIERGYVRIVIGAAEVGRYLTAHESFTDIHVTGSDKTFDAIVFGTGDDGARRKAANRPVTTKPVTGELGSVSPVVIVPGTWSDADIAYQARHVATMLTNNAGFNCLTPRVLVTHDEWPQRDQFLCALEDVLASLPTRRAYYPSARERHDQFVTAHPDATQLGDGSGDRLPWTLVRDVSPRNVDDVSFNVEPFCAVMSETALSASSTTSFISRAVDFCNDVVWGSLSMTLIAHPTTMLDAVTGPAIDQAIADLRFGSIGVNLWHAMSFAFGTTSWGAYPGHDVTDIQSGCGTVGNSYLFARPQKSVVRGPFRASPTPPWFATNTNAGAIMRKLLAFEVQPSWLRVPGLLRASLKK